MALNLALAAEVVQLGKERSSEKRRQLLRQITDLFFVADEVRTAAEEAHFEELVLRLIRDVGLDGRTEFARRIAGEAKAPHHLVVTLAEDTIDVARPILSQSQVLSDQDLVELAEAKGDAALEAIADRQILSERLTDVLMRRGNRLVAHLLIENPGASFSRYGFAEAIRRSSGHEAMQTSLATRVDLPLEVIADLVPALSDKLVEGLMQRGIALPGSVSDAVLEQIGSRVDTLLRERGVEVRHMSTVLENIKSGKRTISREVAELAKLDRAFDLAVLVADLTGIDQPMAMNALIGPNVEPLIVLFRYMRVEWPHFEMVLQMRAKRLRKNYTRSKATQEAYLSMEELTAQRIMRFMLVRRQIEGKKD